MHNITRHTAVSRGDSASSWRACKHPRFLVQYRLRSSLSRVKSCLNFPGWAGMAAGRRILRAWLKRTDLNLRENQGDWFKFASSLSPGHSWTAAGMWPGRGARQAHSCSRPRSQAPGDLGKHTAATGRGLAEAPGNLGNLWFAAAQPPPAWPAILISSHLGAVICKVYCNLQQPP